MVAPFRDYQLMTTIASKVGGPKPFLTGIAGLGAVVGAVAIEATRHLWKPALDGALDKLRNQNILVKGESGEIIPMTSKEIVNKSLSKKDSTKPSEERNSEESAD
ncbi:MULTISPECIES: hypothetical protein [unclassified Bifidobacterium]|uniref:hypothetical protein n=1 Tax=unclassified Bifidobacterium TaxID=2608897 RepID=UPI00112E76D6|nr:MULTISPECIES: hypothetical protein [unclassified Bifidobacterium]TPF79447.1 hypothetical protein BW08_09950 [Bifidobacterium sp. UTCIF-24]TPF89176.1 hypothetical protein BW10_07380 [Bifidobacterium sp. UTBIF-56]